MAERRINLLVTVATLLMIISFGIVAIAKCPNPPKNFVVYEGTENTILSCGLGPGAEMWTVIPRSNTSGEYPITNFTDSVSPALSGLYAINASGLIVRNATIRISTSLSLATAGMYFVYFGDGTKAAAKILVILSGPNCSYTQSEANGTIITCTIIYADYPILPMIPVVNCTAGQVYTTDRTLIPLSPQYFLYNSTTIIKISNSSNTTYNCRATFTAPDLGINPNYKYVATNEPSFSANVTAILTTESPATVPPKVTTAAVSTTAILTTESSATVPPKVTTAAVSTTGQYLSGSLTRKPTNTAAVAGSSNVTLECASIYGTDATRWSFTPLGSSSNETSQISNGYQLSPTYQQKYELHATVNSSILIVRQLSSETEGNYSCYDGVESGSALLLVTPFQISVDPLFGPIAGGTNITIIGSTAIGYFSKYVDKNITGVRNVHIGKDLSSTSVSLLPTESSTFEILAVTSNTTEALIRQPLPIIIEFSPTPFKMSFNKFFVYLPNPVITSIYPNSFSATGGTLIDVFGQGFSSVAKPIIQLTVDISRTVQNSSTSHTSTKICTVPKDNDTYMQCPMPSLSIPDDFLEILNLRYNTNVTRIRRNRDAINHFIANSHSLLSRLKRDVNVLTVTRPNGRDRAEIFLGFILDGYKEYENINDALPDTKLIFYSAPEINSTDELIEFDPSEEELIYVKGRYMMRGCRLIDYVVHIGNQICINSDLQDNQLSCRPPKVKPSSTMNDTIFNCQHLSILITIGYKQYQYACLKYADDSWRLALIIGLTVGLAAFALLIAILITMCIVRCRSKTVRVETDRLEHSRGVELINGRNQNAEGPRPRQETTIVHNRQNPMTSYSPDYDHEIALQQESQQDYDHRIQEYDDNIKPNGNYLPSINDKLNCEW